ncbi:MAG: hypothetical protein HOP29_10140 [Phycisphaerales bacterium]|nr:hypothetical protein [Phycisphaerales bacterium]
MKRLDFVIGTAAVCALGSGCGGMERRPAAESFGKTFYLDGAGNWGFGVNDVPAGLKDAGYRGDVEIYVWTTSLLPMVDQLNIAGAKLRAAALSQRIEEYRRAHPDQSINLIALSAGTGVLIWAIEGLNDNTKVDNVVLLGSSLSADYDASEALRHMTGRIYTYHSPHDEVLEAVRVIGTIDGKRGVDSVGQVGLHPPAGFTDRVVNVGWDRQYMRFGWTGAHTDCTNRRFVEQVVSRHVVRAESPPTGHATHYQPGRPGVMMSVGAARPAVPMRGRSFMLAGDDNGRNDDRGSQ